MTKKLSPRMVLLLQHLAAGSTLHVSTSYSCKWAPYTCMPNESNYKSHYASTVESCCRAKLIRCTKLMCFPSAEYKITAAGIAALQAYNHKQASDQPDWGAGHGGEG